MMEAKRLVAMTENLDVQVKEVNDWESTILIEVIRYARHSKISSNFQNLVTPILRSSVQAAEESQRLQYSES